MSRTKGSKSKKTVIDKSRQAKEVVKQLDEFFGIDEVVDIDELINDEGIKESVGTIENLPKQTHTEDIESPAKRTETPKIDEVKNEIIKKFSKHIYLQNRISMDYIEFELRFRFYLIKENLNASDLTYRRVMKFLREYNDYYLPEVKSVVGSI